MPEFYVSSQNGNDTHDGKSHAQAWKTLARLQRHLNESAAPGDSYLLRAGETFPGSLDYFRAFRGVFGVYDGDARPTVLSGASNGLNFGGSAGLTVRGWKFQGRDGLVKDNHAGLNVGADTEGVEIDGVEAAGYMLGGIFLGGNLRGVTVRRSHLHDNANGLFVSVHSLYGLRLFDSWFDDNGDLNNPLSNGFGASINGVQNVEVSGCKARRNGRRATGGGSGMMLYLCKHATVRHCEFSDNTDPNPETGDGQGLVLDNTESALVEFNECHRNGNGGIQIHSEFDAFEPRNITVRSNFAYDNTVGLSTQGGFGNLLWEGNHVRCDSGDGAYRVAVDVHLAGPDTRFWRNTLEASRGAWLLNAAAGLDNMTFLGGDWVAAVPVFGVRDRTYGSLADALRASQIGTSASGRQSTPNVRFANSNDRKTRLKSFLESLRC